MVVMKVVEEEEEQQQEKEEEEKEDRTKRDRVMPSTDTHVMSHMQHSAVVHWSYLLKIILTDVDIL